MKACVALGVFGFLLGAKAVKASELDFNNPIYLFYDSRGVSIDSFYPEPRGRGDYPPDYEPIDSDARGTVDAVARRVSGTLPYLEIPNTGDLHAAPAGGAADDYGIIVFGRIVPTGTAEYTFFWSSDDKGEFWLSTDASPTNSRLIMRERSWSNVREWSRDGNLIKSDPQSLVEGEAYYFEAVFSEGNAGDNMAVGWSKDPEAIRPENGLPISGTFLEPAADTGPLEFVKAPGPKSVEDGDTAVFTVRAEGSDPFAIGYQWYHEEDPLPDETQRTLSVQADPSMDGSTYSVEVFNRDGTFNTLHSDPVALTVLPDTTPPSIAGITPTPTQRGIIVEFDEPVSSDSAENPDHYTLRRREDGQTIGIVSARQFHARSQLHLETPMLPENTELELTVEGVTDRTARENQGTDTAIFRSLARQRGALAALFYEDPGTSITFYGSSPNLGDDRRGHGNYPLNFNDFGSLIPPFNSLDNVLNRRSGMVSYFESPATGEIDDPPTDQVADDYGQVVTGWITPPVTATYRFFTATDDNSELWLSTNEDPANSRLIAFQPAWTGVREYRTEEGFNYSDPVVLEQGQQYYVELVHSEGGSEDNAAVTWTWSEDRAIPPLPPNGAKPISGQYLSSYQPAREKPSLLSTAPRTPPGKPADNRATIEIRLQDGLAGTKPVIPDSIDFRLNGRRIQPSVSKNDEAITTVTYTPSEPFPNLAIQEVEMRYTYGEVRDSVAFAFKTGVDPGSTFKSGTRYIEANDYNYTDALDRPGQWIPAANGGPEGEPYRGGEYEGLNATAGTDYADVDAEDFGADYRDESPKVWDDRYDHGQGPTRGGFRVHSNWEVIWSAQDEWLNYTRRFPNDPTRYHVYAHIGSAAGRVSMSLSRVTGDPTQPNQSTELLGEFSGPSHGDWDTAIFYRMHETGNASEPAEVTLQGTETLRASVGNHAIDFNYLAFVPLEDEIGLSISHSNGEITVTWQGDATLQSAPTVSGPWSDVSQGSPATIAAESAETLFVRTVE